MTSAYRTSFSALEHTPELAAARRLGKNNWIWDWTFYTTIGHIVTKILDMDITFRLPDGSEYKPFTTFWEVNTFFRITREQYRGNPNPSIMDHFVSDIYRHKVAPKEEAILDPRRQTMREFFEENIWCAVDDSDAVDALFWKIDELLTMWINDITPYVCNNLKELIIMNCIWHLRWLDDWNQLSQEERSEYLVEHLNKNKYTDYFVDLTVDSSWSRHPDNPYNYMMNVVQHKIRALYRVDSAFERKLKRVDYNQFRNTRYV